MKRLRSIGPWSALVLAGSLIPQLVSAAAPPNAWQITDASQATTGGGYNTNLLSAEQSAALSEGWRYSIHARLVDDFNDTATMVFYYGVGTNRFSVYLDLDANNDLTAHGSRPLRKTGFDNPFPQTKDFCK